MVKSLIKIGLVAALTVGAYACGGSGSVGSACTKELDPGACASGALCSKTASGNLECQQVCTAQTDCPASTNCNGTSGSSKVCQVK